MKSDPSPLKVENSRLEVDVAGLVHEWNVFFLDPSRLILDAIGHTLDVSVLLVDFRQMVLDQRRAGSMKRQMLSFPRRREADSVRALTGERARQTTQPVVRVKSRRGFLRGVILRVLEDGGVVVRADGSAIELLALPESLLPED